MEKNNIKERKKISMEVGKQKVREAKKKKKSDRVRLKLWSWKSDEYKEMKVLKLLGCSILDFFVAVVSKSPN